MVAHSHVVDWCSETPFGQLPLLEVEGVTICQSQTIARFLARKFGKLRQCPIPFQCSAVSN